LATRISLLSEVPSSTSPKSRLRGLDGQTARVLAAAGASTISRPFKVGLKEFEVDRAVGNDREADHVPDVHAGGADHVELAEHRYSVDRHLELALSLVGDVGRAVGEVEVDVDHLVGGNREGAGKAEQVGALVVEDRRGGAAGNRDVNAGGRGGRDAETRAREVGRRAGEVSLPVFRIRGVGIPVAVERTAAGVDPVMDGRGGNGNVR
jgi:hypothetical protein